MDPEANLQQQVRLARRIIACLNNDRDPDPHDGNELAGLVAALDDHIQCGGALPESWRLK